MLWNSAIKRLNTAFTTQPLSDSASSAQPKILSHLLAQTGLSSVSSAPGPAAVYKPLTPATIIQETGTKGNTPIIIGSFIIGNESSDLDSFISSLALAFIKNKLHLINMQYKVFIKKQNILLVCDKFNIPLSCLLFYNEEKHSIERISTNCNYDNNEYPCYYEEIINEEYNDNNRNVLEIYPLKDNYKLKVTLTDYNHSTNPHFIIEGIYDHHSIINRDSIESISYTDLIIKKNLYNVEHENPVIIDTSYISCCSIIFNLNSEYYLRGLLDSNFKFTSNAINSNRHTFPNTNTHLPFQDKFPGVNSSASSSVIQKNSTYKQKTFTASNFRKSTGETESCCSDIIYEPDARERHPVSIGHFQNTDLDSTTFKSQNININQYRSVLLNQHRKINPDAPLNHVLLMLLFITIVVDTHHSFINNKPSPDILIIRKIEQLFNLTSQDLITIYNLFSPRHNLFFNIDSLLTDYKAFIINNKRIGTSTIKINKLLNDTEITEIRSFFNKKGVDNFFVMFLVNNDVETISTRNNNNDKYSIQVSDILDYKTSTFKRYIEKRVGHGRSTSSSNLHYNTKLLTSLPETTYASVTDASLSEYITDTFVSDTKMRSTIRYLLINEGLSVPTQEITSTIKIDKTYKIYKVNIGFSRKKYIDYLNNTLAE
ncbi:hypothetical protein CDIK_0325 [Cucumispora dikerogammari]|nr:hypothetical protein CDIK_0325 [Cucumispora dikerogammari]